jgi:hypothetical protein
MKLATDHRRPTAVHQGRNCVPRHCGHSRRWSKSWSIPDSIMTPTCRHIFFEQNGPLRSRTTILASVAACMAP